MPDLNLSLSYFGHRKTKRLVAALGRDADVLPLRLWAYCGEAHPETGTLIGYADSEIESIIGWRGQVGKAIEALVAHNWLDPIEGGYKVHDWEEHQGHLAAYKVRGKIAALARWEKAKTCNKHATSNATSIPQAMLGQCSDVLNRLTNIPAPPLSDAEIPTVEEITAFCSVGLGIPADYCTHYHSKKEIANGWIKNGQLVQWRIEIVSWWQNDKSQWTAKKAKMIDPGATGAQGGASMWEMGKQLEAVEKEIKKIQNRGLDDAFGFTLKDEDKPRMKELKKIRSDLNTKIANGGK